MTSRGGGPLPDGDDPLVLAALLNLLLRRREARTVAFRPGELLELLGWAGSLHDRKVMEDAIRRYHDVSYVVSGPTTGRRAGGKRAAGQEVRPVAECEFERIPVEGSSKVRSYYVVDFDAGFVGQLRGGRYSASTGAASPRRIPKAAPRGGGCPRR